MTYDFHPAAEAEFLESVGYYESVFQVWVTLLLKNLKR